MTDHTWELVGFVACGLVLFVWAAHAWSRWLVRRHRRHMRAFVRSGWDSRQDFVHRVAERGRCERAGLR